MTRMSERALRTTSGRPVIRASSVHHHRVERSGHRVSTGTEMPDSIAARRNLLTALWAGRLLGFSGDDLTAYANSQRFLCKRDAKLIHMIEDDLRSGGVAISSDEVQAALIRYHRVALHQTCATD